MEKLATTIIYRLCVGLIAVAMTAVVTHAQNLLQNPGFETAGTNDATAANWTMFNGAIRQGTNATTVSIRSGLWSLQTAAPTDTAVPDGDASGAYQELSASPGQTWRLTGYLLTWINALMTGPDGYGDLQIQFRDSTDTNVLLSVDSAHVGANQAMPVNTWVPVEVDATAPANTATIRVQALYQGDTACGGNIFFDDLSLYLQPATSGTVSFVSQPGVQISWPTSSPTNGNSEYQLQSIGNLVFSNATVANVCSNGGFEGGTAAPWSVFNGAGLVSSNNSPVHSGAGSMKLAGANNDVPGCYQNTASLTPSVSVTPGQVWNLQGYAYVSSSAPIHSANTRSQLKIVWDNASGTALAAVNPDTNLIGTIDFAPNAGIVSSPQISSSSPQNTWIFLQAQGTAPPNAASASIFCLLEAAPSAPTETCYYDDIVFSQGQAIGGWVNFGPLWLGNGLTNQAVAAIGTNKAQFFRMTTP